MEQRMLYQKRYVSTNDALASTLRLLPERIAVSLERCGNQLKNSVSEIRLRTNGSATVTVSGRNCFLTEEGISAQDLHGIKVSENELEQFLYKLCGGSVYAYEGSVKNGFISVQGIRVGICGEVSLKGNDIAGFSRIQGLNIRIPYHIDGCAEPIVKHISAHGFKANAGILIASAPGVGKTTVLRELALRLSCGITDADKDTRRFYRVCIIDERHELFIPSVFKDAPIDVYSGISKNKGIEFASRVMAPEVIICDEIGSDTDASLIRNVHSGGIILIASIHADSVKDIITKPEIRKMCDDGVFSEIYLLKRNLDSVQGTFISAKDIFTET